MGLYVLYDPDNERAVLYDSVSEWAFGPGFIGDDADEQAQAFIDWLTEDARVMPQNELAARHAQWVRFALDSRGRLLSVGERVAREAQPRYPRK